MIKVLPMANNKNTAKTVRIDRKRSRKEKDLKMKSERANKRFCQSLIVEN